jgi:hypothetical protein
VLAISARLGVVLATGFFLFLAASYWFVGIERTITLEEGILGLTYPAPGGALGPPILDWNRTMFDAQATALFLHIAGCPLALLLGLFQLSSRFHHRFPLAHRRTGVVYLVALAVGVPAGVWLGRFDVAGTISAFGYAFMGSITLVCAAAAAYAIARADVAAHRTWMIRSYAVLWTSSVGFRLLIIFVIPRLAPSLGPLPGSFVAPYAALVFLTPALGLLAADLYLWRRPDASATAAS